MAFLNLASLGRVAVSYFVLRAITFVGCMPINPLQQPDVLSTFNVHNHYQCQRLCWYNAQCARYSFHSADNNEGHNCVLHVNTGTHEELLEGWREESASGNGLHSGHGCLLRPCSNTEMCIPVHGHEKYICVNSPNLHIDECASSPCQNGGNCVDQVNNYTCNCLAGYTGDQCQTDIDECASNPCQNGGSCVDQVNNYTCNCLAGYNGDQCQTGAWLEMACTNSCSPAMVDCFSGRCLCQAGYYFSISQYACVPTCTNLHNSYLFYEGINYYYHDEYDEPAQDVNDITNCETRCNADPQCRTIVLYKPNMKCYFKYSTAVDFPADWRVLANSNTYQKKCV